MQPRNIYAFIYAFAGKNIPISNKKRREIPPPALLLTVKIHAVVFLGRFFGL